MSLPLRNMLRALADEPSRLALYVDKGVIVLNKPAGLIAQGGNHSKNARAITEVGIREDKSLSPLLDALQKEWDLPERPYPVHRLDKGTTGCLLVARTAHLARELSRQFRTHQIEKTYLALVHTNPGFALEPEGEIRTPLKSKDGRMSLAQPGEGRDAATDWEVLASSETAPVSLVQLKLLTGLKHQLRIHMAHCMQCPIVGDDLYSDATLRNAPKNRIFLHASSLSFTRYHKEGPHKELRITIRAPVTDDFHHLCRQLQIPLTEEQIWGGLYLNRSKDKYRHDVVLSVDGRWVGPNIRPKPLSWRRYPNF